MRKRGDSRVALGLTRPSIERTGFHVRAPRVQSRLLSRATRHALHLLSALLLCMVAACAPSDDSGLPPDDGIAAPGPTLTPTETPATTPGSPSPDGSPTPNQSPAVDPTPASPGSPTPSPSPTVDPTPAGPSPTPVPSCQPTAEVCDFTDNDCDGRIDEDLDHHFEDLDGDGYGDPETESCSSTGEEVIVGGDCQDMDATVYPGADELCDLQDNDCDGQIERPYYPDADADGYGQTDAPGCVSGPGFVPLAGDCDDADSRVNPGSDEQCDLIDNDCDGSVDDGTIRYYTDVDLDDYGAGTAYVCLAFDGAATRGGDCDDVDPQVHPGATELCNLRDEDCDGKLDEGTTRYYSDADADGYGDSSTYACLPSEGATTLSGDCDDADPAVHPGAADLCDQLDNDCDDAVDEAATRYFPDLDQDGYGNPGVWQCVPAEGYVSEGSDCDDVDPLRHPGAAELCDGLDNDCDKTVDDGLWAYYRDADGDGHGNRKLAVCAPTDGYVTRSDDCNDADPNAYPGATEYCNDHDDDCDGDLDEGTTRYYPDRDGDRYGSSSSPYICTQLEGYARYGDDCDDADPGAYPGASERCNNRDDDCDRQVDEGFSHWYPDVDLDGYGDQAASSCDPIEGYITQGGDCADTDSSRHPGVCETCDRIDNDCDGSIDESFSIYHPDADHDGQGSSTEYVCHETEGYTGNDDDCDDADPATYYRALERCDGRDNDCDGYVDEGAQRYALDADHDGYGATGTGSCAPLEGSVVAGKDCDDANPASHPSAIELCDGLDNDCDNSVDEADAGYYPDLDGDGYGTGSKAGCAPPEGAATQKGDCDDADPDVHPGAPETADQQDNDCDGSVDEAPIAYYYPDQDGDGHGQGDAAGEDSSPPPGYAFANDDCDDADPDVYPGAPEICDGVSNDCDLDFPPDQVLAFVDDDEDGYGRAGAARVGCDLASGGAPRAGDCDDADPAARPGGIELCDGADNDCDGLVDEDLARWFVDGDGDGFGRSDAFSADGSDGFAGSCTKLEGMVSSRGDCDDADAAVNPGAPDAPDSVDADCGGTGAADPHVGLSDSSATSIRDALALAKDGMTVWVGPGTWREHDLSFDGRRIALRTTQPAGETVIDAAGEGRVMVFENGEGPDTVLDGFTVTGGVAAAQGGGLLIRGSSPTIARCFLKANTSGSLGGGMYVDGGAPRIQGCRLESNKAVYDCTTTSTGDCSSPGTSTTTCAVLSGGQSGGAIFVTDGSVTLEDTLLSGNAAGGACDEYSEHGTTWIDREQCYASSGGAIYANASTVTLVRSMLRWSRASTGGGVVAKGGTLSLAHVVMEGNAAMGTVTEVSQSDPSGIDGDYATTHAGGSGGAIRANGARVVLDHVQVVGSSAYGDGGALSLIGADVDITDTTISGSKNVSSYSYTSSYTDVPWGYDEQYGTSSETASPGGGLFATGSSFTLRSTVIMDNTATGSGAGLWSDGAFLLDDSTVAGNSLEPACESTGSVTEAGVYVTQETCEQTFGGGLALFGDDAVVRHTVFYRNEALLGGGVYASGGAVALEDLLLNSNRAIRTIEEQEYGGDVLDAIYTPGRGGGVFLEASGARLLRARFVANVAQNGGYNPGHGIQESGSGAGGGIFVDAGAPILSRLHLTGNAAFEGGAVAATNAAPVLEQVVALDNHTGYDCDVSSCLSGDTGGIALDQSSAAGARIRNAILAYNHGYELSTTGSEEVPGLTWSDLFDPDGTACNVDDLDPSVVTIEPGFLAYAAGGMSCLPGSSPDCLPVDLHLATGSSLRDAGASELSDVDGSRSDMGIYGGPGGDGWDRDSDGLHDWFWPGTIDEAPSGFNPAEFDCNDLDPQTPGAVPCPQ